VFADGDTVAVPPVIVYVPPVAPEGIMVNDLPEQMLPLFTEMVGVALTVMLLTAVLEPTQPKELVPVTL
jgi:hypothetical protein